MRDDLFVIIALVVGVVLVIGVGVGGYYFSYKDCTFCNVEIVDCEVSENVIIHVKTDKETKTVNSSMYTYTIETEDGNLWEFSTTEDLREKKITVVFNTMKTDTIYDDEIVDYIVK